jgi:hypothetical protein
VAFRPTLTDGLALSTKSIVAGWEDMSKENQIERILTELWIFRQSASGACFYRKSILFACPPHARFHVEIFTLPFARSSFIKVFFIPSF